MSVAPGTRLSHYEIRSQIGAGGMGEVYLADDMQLHRTVALKIFRPDTAGDPQGMKRFTQEAKAASALNHPNILTIYEIGQEDDTSFIATEFIDGETLRTRLTKGPMTITDALDFAIQIGSALSAAHVAGIVHRDVKPENVMVRTDGYVKVLDFGLAKLTGPTLSSVEATTMVNTCAGVIMGTVRYMSPEQARGLETDARTDIWSLGVVLYEMVAGRVPFEGRVAMDVIVSILEREPVALRHYATEIPMGLEEILRKALAKDKEQRYQAIKDLTTDLKDLKQELELRSRLERSMHAPSIDARSASSEIVHNLPGQLTPLIGRETEVADLGQLLRREDVRLLVLTGPGGTGKTRLSLQVALNSLDAFPHGVLFIELGSIKDPNLVASAMARTMKIKQAGDTPLVESLQQYLGDKQILLVLDNFEQVLTTAPLVNQLLSACRNLKVLVTSRAALRVRGESEFPVQPLAVPNLTHLTSVDISHYAAVHLFVERARAVRPDFKITDENAHVVADICIRLDGLPLAIELAAARIKLLSPKAMLARLENRLKVLTGGARDLPTRQQTMRGAIAWGYALLGKEEATLFRRLAVFVGGFTLEGVEALCKAAGDHDVDVVNRLEALVDNSLIQLRHADSEPRFTMLETIREYGLEQLEVSSEESLIHRYHAGFFLELTERAEPHLSGKDQETWLDQLEVEHDNLRAALHWAMTSGETEMSLRLAGSLWRFWLVRGYLSEGRERLEKVLSRRGNSSQTEILAKVLTGAGTLAHNQGDYKSARCLYEESLALCREMGNRAGVADSLNNLGWVAWRQSDYTAARQLSEKSLALHQALRDKKGVAHSLNNVGCVAHFQGDYAEARSYHER